MRGFLENLIPLHRIGVGIFLAVVAVVWRTVFRLFFHRLSSFPGPRLAAVSSYYRTYYEIFKGGAMLEQINHLHSTYGPVIRIGPNELHFADYQAYFDIHSVALQLKKDSSFYSCFAASGSAFGAIDPSDSKSRRAFMHIFLSRRAILKLEPLIQAKVERLVGRLLCTSEPVNLFLAFRSATLDIITTYMFGYCLDALEHSTFSEPLVLSIQNALPLLWFAKSFSWLIPVISVLPRWIGRKPYEQLKAATSIRRYLLSCLHRTREEVQTNTYPKGSTICHYLYDSLSQGSQIFPSERCIVDEALSLLQAGSDTVGNTCTVGSFHILNSPTIHAKLHGELCSNWPNKSESIDLASLQSLPYLTAVIKEALRLSHGFVTPLPRVVGPSGARIAGYLVPPYTVVGTSVTHVHLNPTIFPNPMEFVPERWLTPTSDNLNRYLVPFSIGPRTCLGSSMAWAELYLFFGHLFRKVDLKIVNTSIDDFHSFKDYFVPIHEGRPLHVLSRASQCKSVPEVKNPA